MTNKHQKIHHRIRMSAALGDWDEYERIYNRLIEEAAKFNYGDEPIENGGMGSGIGISTSINEE